jgi:hypothetical protein
VANPNSSTFSFNEDSSEDTSVPGIPRPIRVPSDASDLGLRKPPTSTFVFRWGRSGWFRR